MWDRQDYEHSRARTISLLGFTLMAAGTVLVALGYKSEIECLRQRAGARLQRRWTRLDEVNTAAEESFPASDPPSFTPAAGKSAQRLNR